MSRKYKLYNKEGLYFVSQTGAGFPPYWRRFPVPNMTIVTGAGFPVPNNGKQDSVRISWQTARYEHKVQIYRKWIAALYNHDIGRMDRLGQ